MYVQLLLYLLYSDLVLCLSIVFEFMTFPLTVFIECLPVPQGRTSISQDSPLYTGCSSAR